MSEEALKLNLINKILSLNNISLLKKVEETLDEISEDDLILQKLNKPMRKKLDIEVLKKEQNYKPINKEAFFKKMDDLNIEEPIEELLAMI